MTNSPERIAILGAGPAGSSTAALLAKAGKNVVLFDSGKRPPLVVGESLIPAVIPLLRQLGVEDEVKSFSVYKPGATFRMDEVENHYLFGEFGRLFPGYAYNSPRDQFDMAILNAAKRAGAKHLVGLAHIQHTPGSDHIELDSDSLALASKALGGSPELIIDATGRNRMFANQAEIPSRTGPRKDMVLFAHIDHAKTTMPGNIHIGRLTHGWNWFIPLPGRMSLGIVMDSAHWDAHGSTNEERYDHIRNTEPMLTEYAAGATRLTPVMKYNNYQLVTKRFVGDGWALVGDAGGFVDPIFSSGLFLAMSSAANLAKAIVQGSPRAMQNYQSETLRLITTWQRIVDLYYAGALFTLFKVRRDQPAGPVMRLIREHVFQHMGRVFTGEAATGRYSIALIELIARYGIKSENVDLMKIN